MVHGLGSNAFLALLCQFALKIVTAQNSGYTVQLLSFSVLRLVLIVSKALLIDVDTHSFKCRSLRLNNIFEGFQHYFRQKPH